MKLNAKAAATGTLAVILLPSALSADPLSSAFKPFAGFNAGNLYTTYQPFLDFVLISLLFISVCMFALKEQFKGQTAIPVTIGIILALATVWYANKIKFRLSDLGPYALTLALILIAVAVYSIFKGMDMKSNYSAAWGFIIAWSALTTVGAKILEEIPEDSMLQTIIGLMHLVFLIVLIFAIIGMFTWATSIGTAPGAAGAPAVQPAQDAHGAAGGGAAPAAAQQGQQGAAEFNEFGAAFGNVFQSVQQITNIIRNHAEHHITQALTAGMSASDKNSHITAAINALQAANAALDQLNSAANQMDQLAPQAFRNAQRRQAVTMAMPIIRTQVAGLRHNIAEALTWLHQGRDTPPGAPIAQKDHRVTQARDQIQNTPGHAIHRINVIINQCQHHIQPAVDAGP